MVQEEENKFDTISMIFKDSAEKTDLEILQERAEVLGRAGEKLSAALRNLNLIEEIIEDRLRSYLECKEQGNSPPKGALREINLEIRRYNEAREYAKLRLYYLIVTREAMGFRRNKTVEEQYPIPPKKKPLKKAAWTDIRNRE
jgi:hypothetical protein